MNQCIEQDETPRLDGAPAVIDGFPAFAPGVARDGAGFQSDFFAKLAQAEDNHFWFNARNSLIVWALQQYCPTLRSFLEVGCGTGYVLRGIAQAYPQASLSGSELFSAGLRFAAARVPGAQFMQMDARDIPFERRYEAIGAFDVIEHIEEDAVVLQQLHKALCDDGILLVTVPQHQWLWSQYDDYACHVRRYSKTELHDKLYGAGFEVIRSTSFVTSLLPALIASRALSKKQNIAEYDSASELQIPAVVNAVFGSFLAIERACIRVGIDLPIGSSRLVIARKRRAG